MKYTILFSITILLTVSANTYLIGKHQSDAKHRKVAELCRTSGDLTMALVCEEARV